MTALSRHLDYLMRMTIDILPSDSESDISEEETWEDSACPLLNDLGDSD